MKCCYVYTHVKINVIRLYVNTLICSTIERGKQNMDETWYPSSKQLFMNNLNKTSNSISPKKEWVKKKHEWMPLLNATRLHLYTWRTIKTSNHKHIFFKARYSSTVTFTTEELNCRYFNRRDEMLSKLFLCLIGSNSRTITEDFVVYIYIYK